MIYTSYFAHYKGSNGVSIARWSPKWFNGLEYKLLAPSVNLLNWWKTLSKEEQHNIDNINTYIKIYKEETLSVLENQITEIYSALDNKVLLCYENINKDFCHRNVVTKWFQEHGFECKELD